jgi:hypothetical protein
MYPLRCFCWCKKKERKKKDEKKKRTEKKEKRKKEGKKEKREKGKKGIKKSGITKLYSNPYLYTCTHDLYTSSRTFPNQSLPVLSHLLLLLLVQQAGLCLQTKLV